VIEDFNFLFSDNRQMKRVTPTRLLILNERQSHSMIGRGFPAAGMSCVLLESHLEITAW
ncbi:hypothetical protein RUM43_000563, partial [Polyplax serrata]